MVGLTIQLCTSDVAVEKNNDDARRNYRSSNKLDGAKEIILADARMEVLTHYERDCRVYTKSSTEYWEKGIYSNRKRDHED